MTLYTLWDPSDRRPERPIAVVIVGKHGDQTVSRIAPDEARAHAAKLTELADRAEAGQAAAQATTDS
jgi:hypothetical protein